MRKKNVYTKSMLRQPIHSLILTFLIFIATFGFVLRSVEFLTVRDEIFSIASYYQTVGFISGSGEFANVSDGADFLENSGYIELSDRRRGVQAFLQGMLNSDVEGIYYYFWEDRESWDRFHDAFFYGELIDKLEHPEGGWRLILAVDDVLVGYPEHVIEGQKMQMDVQVDSVVENMEIGERYFLRGIF